MKNNSKNENSILYPILITVGIFLLVVLFIWASSKKDDSNSNSSSETTTESIQDVTSSENEEQFSSEIESSTESSEETTTETTVEESSEETSSEASSETEESSVESTTEAETSMEVEISTEMSSEDVTTTSTETEELTTEESTTTAPIVVQPTTEAETEPIPTMSIEVEENKDLSLGEELEIVDIGKYTGLFFEDGTDEAVSNIVMMVIKNNGDKDLQYAEIELTTDMRTLNFYVTTLKAGASVLVLELNRQSYISGEEYIEAKLNNDIFFQSELTVYEDVFKIGALDGAMNVTNISDKDITGEVIIYYKNRSSDMYYGGITYRTRIPEIKAGEIKQIMLKHFSPTGSEIMFVTYTE